MLIAEGAVAVNGEIDTRRRRQLKNGDVVEVGGTRAVVDLPEEPGDPEERYHPDPRVGQSMGV